MADFSKDELAKVLKSWEGDEFEYRNGSGQKFLSQSDVGSLLRSPKEFRAPRDKPVLAFIQGSYFHESILEPHKIKDYKIVDASTRSTKIYKEALAEAGTDILLLRHEKDKLDQLVEGMLKNKFMRSMIRAEGNIYEKPGVIKLFGEWFKGRADIICPSQGLIIDLKTSRELPKFRYKAKSYYYHAQAYIYSKMFDLDFMFFAACKETGDLGVFECSKAFLQEGKLAVEQAVKVHQEYYKDKTAEQTQALLANRVYHQELY